MIQNIDKPALSASMAKQKRYECCFGSWANIECSSKNLIDFSILGPHYTNRFIH